MKKGAVVIEGHVQGLSNVRSLGELGVPVYVVDVAYCLAQHSRYCLKYFKCPPFSSESFIDFLVQLGNSEHLEEWVLIPSNDHIVENIVKNRERLSPYYTMMGPSSNHLYDIIDKKRLLSVAKGCGTHIPLTYYKDDLADAENFRYPVLIKGNLGLSFYKAMHVKAIQVDSCRELRALIPSIQDKVNLSDVMIQELIPESAKDKVVSFTCFAVRGSIKAYWMGRKLREHPVKYGTGTFAESTYISVLLDEARPLVAALEYSGVCEIEYMYDERDDVYKLIEINPRTWLWVGLAKACGVDYVKMIYNQVNGINQTFPNGYPVGVKWINRLTDFTYAMKAICCGRLSLNGYLKSLRGNKVFAVWSSHDILPGLIFPLMSLYIYKKRK